MKVRNAFPTFPACLDVLCVWVLFYSLACSSEGSAVSQRYADVAKAERVNYEAACLNLGTDCQGSLFDTPQVCTVFPVGGPALPAGSGGSTNQLPSSIACAPPRAAGQWCLADATSDQCQRGHECVRQSDLSDSDRRAIATTLQAFLASRPDISPDPNNSLPRQPLDPSLISAIVDNTLNGLGRCALVQGSQRNTVPNSTDQNGGISAEDRDAILQGIASEPDDSLRQGQPCNTNEQCQGELTCRPGQWRLRVYLPSAPDTAVPVDFFRTCQTPANPCPVDQWRCGMRSAYPGSGWCDVDEADSPKKDCRSGSLCRSAGGVSWGILSSMTDSARFVYGVCRPL